MKTGTVYCATNLANQKVYIGQTIRTPKQRKYEHGRECKVGNSHFKRALRKYSIEGFKWTILCKVSAPTKLLVKNYLDIAEQMYIKQYDSMNKSTGYNLIQGGGGLVGFTHTECTKKKMSASKIGKKNPMFGRHCSEETRRKHSVSNKGKIVSTETRKKLSKANRGENHPLFGKHLPEETRKKIGESNKGRVVTLETRKKISESRKGMHFSLETRKRISESKRGANHPFFGKHHSKETRKKISEAHMGEKNYMFGKHHSEERKEKLSKANKGENHPMFGTHRSEETRKKLSESLKKYWAKRNAV